MASFSPMPPPRLALLLKEECQGVAEGQRGQQVHQTLTKASADRVCHPRARRIRMGHDGRCQVIAPRSVDGG